MILRLLTLLCLSWSFVAEADAILVPKGRFQSPFPEKNEKETVVGPIRVDRSPVTNQDFLSFVRQHPEWRKAKVPRLFADASYLSRWAEDLRFAKKEELFPVTNVSWFAARAYCESQNARLPTIAEWEYFADTQSPAYEEATLRWFEKAGEALRPVGQSKPNRFGLIDTSALVWEWVEDFSSVFMAGDARDNDSAKGMFCGGAALGAKDPRLYAAFMRYAFRSSLKAGYTSPTLGFRCVKD